MDHNRSCDKHAQPNKELLHVMNPEIKLQASCEFAHKCKLACKRSNTNPECTVNCQKKSPF